MNVRWVVLWWLVILAGCQSTHEQLIAEGYPPAFADGFQDGCGSGREAAGANGLYKKDVPRALKDAVYAEGWSDGFRQCQGEALSRDRPDAGSIYNDRDRRWEQQKTQDAGRAYKPR